MTYHFFKLLSKMGKVKKNEGIKRKIATYCEPVPIHFRHPIGKVNLVAEFVR